MCNSAGSLELSERWSEIGENTWAGTGEVLLVTLLPMSGQVFRTLHIPAGFSSPGRNIHRRELPVHFPSSCELNVCFFLPSPPPFLLFLQSDIKNMNLQLGKEKCHWLKAFFASGKPEMLLGVCLFNLLFAVRNLGGKLQNVVWLQMRWCFAF